jgi:1,4-dihydroxy-2-naphthoate octaprenyltransferase
VNTRKITSFIRLSRPIFLVGGIVMYALGALVARYEGFTIGLSVYGLGQIAVTSTQLMGHYLNEYWDVEGDRINPNRTFFTGGSGILPTGEISRRTALLAALVCLFVGSSAILGLSIWFGAGATSMMIFALGLVGVFSYSGPPLKLSSTGFGELVVALMVSLLVPLLGYQLQAGHFGYFVVLATAPLVAINWMMLVFFEFPDIETDRAVGKRTLLVRLGSKRGQALVSATTLGAFGLIALLSMTLLPRPVALALFAVPIAIVTMVLARQAVEVGKTRYSWLTFSAISLYAIAALLETVGIFLSA